MKQSTETAFETAIASVLLNDGYSKLAADAFDTERAIFADEALAHCMRLHPRHLRLTGHRRRHP